MSPTQVLVALMIAGVAVLLVAPKIHRRSTQKSRIARRDQRMVRVADLRAEGQSAEYLMTNAQAAQMRDALLLNGVRAELAAVTNATLLVVDAADGPATEDRLSQAGIAIQKK